MPQTLQNHQELSLWLFFTFCSCQLACTPVHQQAAAAHQHALTHHSHWCESCCAVITKQPLVHLQLLHCFSNKWSWCQLRRSSRFWISTTMGFLLEKQADSSVMVVKQDFFCEQNQKGGWNPSPIQCEWAEWNNSQFKEKITRVNKVRAARNPATCLMVRIFPFSWFHGGGHGHVKSAKALWTKTPVKHQFIVAVSAMMHKLMKIDVQCKDPTRDCCRTGAASSGRAWLLVIWLFGQPP